MNLLTDGAIIMCAFISDFTIFKILLYDEASECIGNFVQGQLVEINESMK